MRLVRREYKLCGPRDRVDNPPLHWTAAAKRLL